MTTVKERPIVLSADEVRAAKTGALTIIRPMKPQPWRLRRGSRMRWEWAPVNAVTQSDGRITPSCRWHDVPHIHCQHCDPLVQHCTYGRPGERLWVREEWRLGRCPKDRFGMALYHIDRAGKLHPHETPGTEDYCREWRTRPTVAMPRWASRLLLEIESVNVVLVKKLADNCWCWSLALTVVPPAQI